VKIQPVTLEALAKYPIVTYHAAFTGRSKIDAAFEGKGLSPRIVLTALDSDVIKTYVELGFGVGIVSMLAYDPARDTQFDKIDASHLFAPSTARLGLRQGVFLRGYVYDFITMFAPQFDQSAVEAALRGKSESYEL
jgi:LysR family cys regulon transcriptional activator